MVEELGPIFVLLQFFSGLSYHLLLAIAPYLFSLNMSFGSTMKEIKHTNLFQEVLDLLHSILLYSPSLYIFDPSYFIYPDFSSGSPSITFVSIH